MRFVRLLKEGGREPPGIAPFPISEREVRAVREEPSSVGIAAGMPGNVRDLEGKRVWLAYEVSGLRFLKGKKKK